MPRKKKRIIKVKVDKETEYIIGVIKKDIRDGFYEMNWSAFVKSAIQLLVVILDNNISPLQFELFVDAFRKEKKICEA